MPATPPPMTSARRVTGMAIGCKAWLQRTLATAMRISSTALAVASLPIVMHPGAMLADIGHFDQIGIQSLQGGRFAKGPQVHVGRTGSHDDAGQPFGDDFPANERLPRIGAHVLVGDRARDAGQLGDLRGRLLHVDVAGDVLAAPANKNADPCHAGLSFHYKVSIDAQRAFVQADGQANQIGKIIHRQIVAAAVAALDVGLFHVEIDVAHRAGDHDAVGAVLAGRC